MPNSFEVFGEINRIEDTFETKGTASFWYVYKSESYSRPGHLACIQQNEEEWIEDNCKRWTIEPHLLNTIFCLKDMNELTLEQILDIIERGD